MEINDQGRIVVPKYATTEPATAPQDEEKHEAVPPESGEWVPLDDRCAVIWPEKYTEGKGFVRAPRLQVDPSPKELSDGFAFLLGVLSGELKKIPFDVEMELRKSLKEYKTTDGGYSLPHDMKILSLTDELKDTSPVCSKEEGICDMQNKWVEALGELGEEEHQPGEANKCLDIPLTPLIRRVIFAGLLADVYPMAESWHSHGPDTTTWYPSHSLAVRFPYTTEQLDVNSLKKFVQSIAEGGWNVLIYGTFHNLVLEEDPQTGKSDISYKRNPADFNSITAIYTMEISMGSIRRGDIYMMEREHCKCGFCDDMVVKCMYRCGLGRLTPKRMADSATRGMAHGFRKNPHKCELCKMSDELFLFREGAWDTDHLVRTGTFSYPQSIDGDDSDDDSGDDAEASGEDKYDGYGYEDYPSGSDDDEEDEGGFIGDDERETSATDGETAYIGAPIPGYGIQKVARCSLM